MKAFAGSHGSPRRTLLSASIGALAWLVAAGPVPAREGLLVQRLANGLSVILEEDHSRPLIGVSLCVKGGCRTETPEIAGLSHYYEHLLFRGGSQEQAPLEFRKQLQQIGDESGGYTAEDYTNYGFTVPKESFDEAFRRATDGWLHYIPTQDKIDAERQVVLEEYNQDEDRPDYQVYYQLTRLLYKAHPYRIGAIGLREAIEGAGLETFRTFYEERYAPNQMVLSMVGDFDADAMLRRIMGTWGNVSPNRSGFETGAVESEQTEFRFAEKGMETATSKVVLGFPVPPATHADVPALELAAAILGAGNSSRLRAALKIRTDLAVAISAWVDRRVDPGYFGVDLEVEPARTTGALAAVAGELTRLAAQPPPVEELGRAREMLLARRERSLQTVFDRAEALGVAEVFGSAHDVDRYPALLRSVAPEEISRVVARYLRPDRGNLSIVRPDSAAPFDPGPWVREWRQAWGSVPLAPEAASSGIAPYRTVLDNGLVVVVRQVPHASMAGAVVLVRGGQWAEPSGLSGIANFTAELLDRGAGDRNHSCKSPTVSGASGRR